MPVFTAEGMFYNDAVKLIEALKQEGMYANFTTGGVNIQVTPDQINRATEITKQFGGTFTAGYSSVEVNSLLKHGSHDNVEQVTNDSQAVLQEWSE